MSYYKIFLNIIIKNPKINKKIYIPQLNNNNNKDTNINNESNNQIKNIKEEKKENNDDRPKLSFLTFKTAETTSLKTKDEINDNNNKEGQKYKFIKLNE